MHFLISLVNTFGDGVLTRLIEIAYQKYILSTATTKISDNNPLCFPITQILVYVGSKSTKWVNPQKLASYDVILTDYETLRTEFDYTERNASDRVLRNSSVIIKRKSPLLNLNFWRLCLDESQMVIDMKTKHAQLISDLSAVHRWAVTGTPIETSLNDLFGLLSFINYEPYNQPRRWSEIMNALNNSSNVEPLVSILQPIMWRTCKSENIMNEMNVPKQVQQVHYVELDDLNRYHYNKERDCCRQTFNRLISSYRLDTPLMNLSPCTLEQVSKPLGEIYFSFCHPPAQLLD